MRSNANKNILSQIFTTIIGGAGAIIFSQALSFGWYKKGGIGIDFVLHDHSLILGIAGIGLIAAGVFVQSTSRRVSLLEKEIEELKARR